MATKDIVLAALFAAIIILLGIVPAISLGFIPVPVTAQSLGVMLAGAVLGAKRGVMATLLVMLIAAIGMPILAGGRGGIGVFMAPTTGYLIGWAFAAAVTGYLAERLITPEQTGLTQIVYFFIASVIGGIVVLYALGITWVAFFTGIGLSKAFLGSLIFIPGDILKAGIAALAGRAVMVGYPLLPQRA
ncbi:biotin transporter BioY [Rhizobium oryzicola]|uniref:Biotin transporter n=1 Tax=Rhizobium oryzicola TaxID=1232668 RepID=A0ABT8SS77_9HYPH|nr:biotin transporter BioY [Rhizobium oryzicola]MDO1581278.1 biotin transporter BioY [Rhizobium oryzicola]